MRALISLVAWPPRSSCPFTAGTAGGVAEIGARQGSLHAVAARAACAVYSESAAAAPSLPSKSLQLGFQYTVRAQAALTRSCRPAGSSGRWGAASSPPAPSTQIWQTGAGRAARGGLPSGPCTLAPLCAAPRAAAASGLACRPGSRPAAGRIRRGHGHKPGSSPSRARARLRHLVCDFLVMLRVGLVDFPGAGRVSHVLRAERAREHW